MKTYLFASKRHPANPPYTTTVFDDGAITCSCPARVECWHIKSVREEPPVGRMNIVVSGADCIAIFRLLAEGNDDGARELVRTLFPSIAAEEEIDMVLEPLRLQMLEEDDDPYGLADALDARARETD